jgi:membrane associated rhomboid family serine protease
MQYYYRSTIGFGRPWTPMVKRLIIINCAVFVLQLFGFQEFFLRYFALNTDLAFSRLMIWQFFTYMFLHGGAWHLFFNMFALWMFGSEMEDFFGRKEFLFYYFMTGIGAGLILWILDLVTGQRSLTVGASGAVFGILLAYGLVYARRQITLLIFFFLPVTMEARTFVIAFAVMELLLGISPDTTGVAHFAHLGGMLFGYLYFKFFRGSIRPYFYGRSVLGDVGQRFHQKREEDDQRRLDQILDKINQYGSHTLTDSEKKFLEEMSKKQGH